MILIVTNRQDHTADYLILELQKRKVDYVRFNTEDFPQRVKLVWRVDESGLEGYFSFPRCRVNLKDIKSIWYRRPSPPVPDPEIDNIIVQEFIVTESQASLEGLWRCLDCFWISHPDNLKRAEYKLYQLKVAKQLGFRLWPTILTNHSKSAQEFYYEQNCQVVYKPLRRGRILHEDGVGLIYTNLIGFEEGMNLDKVEYAPSLLQKYVPKRVEIRVTVIGSKVFAVEIHSQDHIEAIHDWRRGDMTRLNHLPHRLSSEMVSMCINLVNILGLAFGAIDFILTPEDEYVFLEINPNGQWAWIQQLRPEIPLRETLADLLITCGSIEDV